MNKSRLYHELYRYLMLVIMLFITACNFNLLMKPINFVTGGTPGLAIIVEHVFHIPVDYFLYGVYIVMFIISVIVLGKESILGILVATIFYPLFVTLTRDIVNVIAIDYDNIFILCIFATTISGLANGFIYKMGFASSGLSTLAPICNKCFNISIAKTNFVMNTIIVCLGGYYFGLEMVLYAIVFLYLNSIITNKTILGISNNKAVFIRSNKLDEISDMLYHDYKIEGINIESYVKNIDNHDYISLVVIPTMKYNLIIGRMKEIDQQIFYDVLDGYEVKEKSIKY